MLDVCCWSVLLCVDFVFFPFCDARYKRYLGDIGKDLLEMNRSLFLWSLRRSPGTLCWKQASYFTEIAFIYIYFDHLKYSKVAMILKIFFTKTWKKNYFATLYGGIGWKILFQTIVWEKHGLFQTPFKVPGWMWHAEMSVLITTVLEDHV